MNLLNIFIKQAKASITLALPIILSELTGSLGSFIGTLMIARVGEDALAAQALVNTTFITLMASCWGVILSVGVVASQAYGAKQHATISNTVGQGFWLAVVLSVFLMLLLQQASPIFFALGQNPKSVAIAQSYFNPVSLGILPGLYAGVLQQFVLTLKYSRVVMACTIASVLFSIPLNYILIFGKFGMPALGLAGVGWCTMAVHCFMLLFMTAYILFNKTTRQYHVYKAIFRWDFQKFKELFSIGWPIGGMLGVEICGLLAAVLLCGLLGNQSLAAYQIAMQCMITSIMIPWGMGQGTTILVGHAQGENDLKKAKHAGLVGMLIATFATFIIGIIFWIFPLPIVRLFVDIHSASALPIVKLVVPMLYVLGATIFFDGIRIVASGALRGLKDTQMALILGIISFWVIGLPIGYLFAFTWHWGALGLWIGDLLGVIVGMIILVYRFHRLVERPITVDAG